MSISDIPENIRNLFNDPSNKPKDEKTSGEIQGRPIVVLSKKEGFKVRDKENQLSRWTKIQAYFGYGKASFANVLHELGKKGFEEFSSKQLENLRVKAEKYGSQHKLSSNQRNKVNIAIKKLENRLLEGTDSTILDSVIVNGKADFAEKFIPKMGKDDLAKRNSEGNTPLHVAIQEKRPEIAKLLIQNMNEKDLARRNKDGHTPLHLLVGKGNAEVAELLINKMRREDFLKEDKKGVDLLQYVIDSNDSVIINLLNARLR